MFMSSEKVLIYRTITDSSKHKYHTMLCHVVDEIIDLSPIFTFTLHQQQFIISVLMEISRKCDYQHLCSGGTTGYGTFAPPPQKNKIIFSIFLPPPVCLPKIITKCYDRPNLTITV